MKARGERIGISYEDHSRNNRERNEIKSPAGEHTVNCFRYHMHDDTNPPG